ncbi:MAG: TonB-dependent receptor [Proteobacteria bacterium]|nr:TonB-dependent receptor [Pseudomonadota bacterium]
MINRNNAPWAMVVSMGVAALAGQPTFAQANAAESRGPTLEEVVVTARKREESLQDVPLPVTALSAADIANRQVTSLDDVAKFTPGLVFSKVFGRATERPVIRGLASVLAGTNASVETGAAYFVDGIYYQGAIQSLDMNDVERVEIIRGPQSALYGRNTYSGAINFVTKRIGDTTTGSASASFDTDERNLSARVAGRLTDWLAGSVNGRYYDFDGQHVNQLTGRNVGDESSNSFGVNLEITPTETTELRLRYQSTRDRDGTRPIFFQSGGDNNCVPGTRSLGSYNSTSTDNPNQWFCGEVRPGLVYLNDAPVTRRGPGVIGIPSTLRGQAPGSLIYDTRQGVAFSGVHRDAEFASAGFRWDIMGSGYNLVLNGGWRGEDLKTGADSDHSEVNIIGANVNGIQPMATGASSGLATFEDWSSELRIESPQEDRLRWMVGIYHYEWENKNYRIDFASLGGQDRPEQLSDIINTGYFGSIGFDFTDRLSASLEIRRAEERKGQIDWAVVVNNQAGPTAAPTYNSALRGNDEWKSTTPRATVDFKLNEDITLYAIYAKGYKPGGFNGAVAITNGRPADESFLQEESVNYELGMKSQWFDRRLVLNVGVFKMEIDAIQLTTPITNSVGAVTSIATNQGDGEITGLEIESRYAVTDDFTVGFTYAMADTEFTNGIDDFQWQITSGGGIFNPANPTDPARNLNGRGNASIAGNPFPLAAKHTASLTGDYSRPVFGGDYRLYVNTDLSYTSKKNVQVHNTAYTGSALLAGARIGIETDSWRVGLYGRNLLNEDSLPGATRWLHSYLFGVPATAGPAATLDPGLPSTAVAAYSLPRGIFGTLRRERQIGLELNYKF